MRIFLFLFLPLLAFGQNKLKLESDSTITLKLSSDNTMLTSTSGETWTRILFGEEIPGVQTRCEYWEEYSRWSAKRPGNLNCEHRWLEADYADVN